MSVIVSVTPVALEVAFAESSTDVALLIVVMVVPAGIEPPVIEEPTSAAVKAAVADVTVAELAVVTPSVTTRTGAGEVMLTVGTAESVTVAGVENTDAPVPSEPPVVAWPHVRTLKARVPGLLYVPAAIVIDCVPVVTLPPTVA